jgi:heme exporter protein A
MLTYPRTPRALCREVLDSDSPEPAAAATEFRFLRRLNRATGASAALLDAIERRIAPRPQQAITLADFGTGAGDIAIEAVRAASRRGWTLSATLTDHAAEALLHARAAAAAAGEQGIQFGKYDLVGEEATLEAAPFKVAHASLVLHHFSDEGVVRALHRMSRCASDLLVWNDLIRDRIGLLGASVATLGRSPTLRHDAILSVRRSFTLVEARAFAEAAGLVEIEVRRWRGARFILTAKPAPHDQRFPTPRPLIRAIKLGFSFGSSTVFKDRSFVLRAGEVGLAAGPNGSGKTTLLRLLAGVLRPASGDAWSDSSEGPIGYLPQRGGLIATLSIGANLEMLQRIAGVHPSHRGAKTHDAVARFGLSSIVSRPIARLSVGQARRAAIASVWATAGRALLLDEPDAGLDAEGRERLGLALVEHAREGGAALVASHEWSWLERACAEGGIVFTGSVIN